MERIAVFAGSFDPFTVAHLAIVKRASAIFDRVIVVVGKNVQKNSLLSVETRMRFVQKATANLKNVTVDSFDGLTVEYMKNSGAKFLVRGIRSAVEFDAERNLAWNNQMLYPQAETVFLQIEPELSSVSSSAVREILHFGGDVSKMIPAEFFPDLISEMEKH
ncbi:MAG: pantetheine-phosphate adenylyltransferase [Hallerella succinigenes]|uniref:pantetheine-phosphate adenylyltransferase n=1 Tax=Hallerella succinigenes TaxID=1896222 RepID=UPI0023F3FB8C|nr:pantetheine-phosphate adenylyltransferase [Hallerella succinigenes]MDD6091859.1 pantetheine-phosphate adenylyltransferase [Hallerella succinigenes]